MTAIFVKKIKEGKDKLQQYVKGKRNWILQTFSKVII